MVDVFATVHGGSEAAAAVERSVCGLGVESQNQLQTDPEPIEFVDFPFTQETQEFGDHRDVVAEIEPALTVAPDIERGRDPETVYEQARELEEYARDVIVVPKNIHPTNVPDCFRVGLPLAAFGSDDKWQITDYHGCESVHLLGGSPIDQLRTIKLLGGSVDSTDSAAVFKSASVGDIFAPTQSRSTKNGWKHWFETGETVGYYDRVEVSLNNSHLAFNNPTEAYSLEYTRPGDAVHDADPLQSQLVF